MCLPSVHLTISFIHVSTICPPDYPRREATNAWKLLVPVPYGENFLQDKSFAVFVHLPQTAKIQTLATHFACNRRGLLSAIGVAYCLQ